MRISLALVIGAGILFHAWKLLLHAPSHASSFAVGLFCFSAAPYAVAAILGCFRRTVTAGVGFALGALAGDLFALYWVAVISRGSMSGYLFLVMPGVNLLALGPVGALLFWVGVKLMRRRSEPGRRER